ncbi:cytochrome P450 [Phanerochaete sordida]|uniref:Cytochrome P450 n=1 Tax=Phanerochaete sordida TaxID=48140 RepID=A0A9P3LKR4_9APHY|nr:cytochrome P450 [Phanerochaete sordida]
MLNLMGWQRLFALAPYGDDWKARTRIFQQHFNSSTTVKYRPTLLTAAHLLLSNIRKRQDAFLEHFRHLAAYSIMGVTYGIEVRAQDDRYLEVAERGTRCLARAIKAGGHAVDVLPFLRYLPAWAPGAQFKRDAIEWSKDVTAMLDVPFEFVEQNLNGGVQNTSAVGTVLRDIEQSEDQSGAKEVARDAFGTAYVGGANTAYGALTIFTLAMLKYPHVQVKGQEHIDHVVGRERLPDFSDREALPYITAIVQEVLRWIVISPLAVPHRLTVDDEYEGCHFRAGSLFVGNAWAILHDETRYPDPEAFMPERYLAPDGKLDENAPDPTEACFGYGRRMCPGRQFALEEIWIAVVSLLAAFSIEKAIDEFGAIIEPSGEDMTASGAV